MQTERLTYTKQATGIIIRLSAFQLRDQKYYVMENEVNSNNMVYN